MADGTPTNALYGFIQMLLRSIEKIQPDCIACSLESETPTFRHVIAHDYKANRKEMDSELSVQIGEVINILHTLGIGILQKNGYEADDVIGSFAKQNESKFEKIEIVTGDRDLLQLLSEKIKILMPGKTFSDFVEYDREKFEEKYGIKLEDFVLFKSLTGDSSDNIKGIPGVGPKTAQKIVNQYHSVESILANTDELPPRIAESLIEYKDLWLNFYKLSEIEKDIKLDVTPEDLRIEKLQVYKLRSIIEKYEFKSLAKTIGKFIDNFEKRHGSFSLFDTFENLSDKKEEINYTLVDKVTFPSIEDSEPLNLEKKAYILSGNNSVKFGDGKEFIEINHDELYNFVITNQLKHFIGFDLKPFIKLLLKSGIEHIEKYTFFDLNLAWHLIRSDFRLESINELVKHLNEEDYVKVYSHTKEKIEKEGLSELFKIEQELQKVLAFMEFSGICCDRGYLLSLKDEYERKIEEVKKEIFDFVGHEFNPASTRDLGHILFEVLKLPVQKKNKTGYSTDDLTLTKLEGMSDIIPMIKRFRAYSKILSTYVVGLLNSIGEDGKIHTTFNQTLVATGRLSSTNPNLQNLPADEDAGIKIKKAFVTCDENKVFLSFDYSQIDLRVLAFESKDSGLIKAFQNHEDIHTTTGKVIFEKPELTKQERNFAKTINFGIVYGMEPYGLSQALKIDQSAAKQFIDRYFEKFEGVKKYFDRITEQLDKKQFVNTFLGRKRFFPTWQRATGFQKRMLFREAINMPIQGGSSELIKIAMVKIFQYLRENEIKCTPLLQIHDELIFEVAKSEDMEKLKKDIKDIMCTAYDLGIPVEVSEREGRNLAFVE